MSAESHNPFADEPPAPPPDDSPFSPIDFRAALNGEQYAAVTAPDGPALILAGAGSGKTRTLTYRVAWLLAQGVWASRILLLTFTNKAAREMLQRVEELTGVEGRRLWGGTFHCIGQRFLRMHGEPVGIGPRFTILDQGEAESLLGEVIAAEDPAYLKNKNHPKAKVLADVISYARNTARAVDDVFAKRYPFFEQLAGRVASFYQAYQKRKLELQVTDYDDLLDYWLKLLKQEEDVRKQYEERFRYVLVDEYQDTNPLQAAIVDTLAGHGRIMAVGDDAQCIYTWRGADFGNIMSFPDRHEGAALHKIETNYRSTPEILAFANQVLARQPVGQGYAKELRAVRDHDQLPVFVPIMDGRQEALFVASRIRQLYDEGHSLGDIAVLYRAHYQAMDVQMELSRAQVPYIITSGVRFFEQAHVKDLVAHLRMVANPTDTLAFQRLACLFPKVGPKTAQNLLRLAEAKAAKKDEPLVFSLSEETLLAKVREEGRDGFRDMALTLQNLHEAAYGTAKQAQGEASSAPAHAPAQGDLFDTDRDHPGQPASGAETNEGQRGGATPSELVRLALEGWYREAIRTLYPNWQQRMEDLESLVGFAERYQSLDELLAQLVLLNSETSDRSTDPGREDAVRLTTIHQAKGLEFPVVFVIGLADGMFPLRRAIEEDDLEEERRLFYVSVTRAQDELYLTYPMISMKGGPPQKLEPSRFVREVDEAYFEVVKPQGSW